MPSSTILFARSAGLESVWPFVAERLHYRLSEIGEVRVLPATAAPSASRRSWPMSWRSHCSAVS
jgi:hypothetical protein